MCNFLEEDFYKHTQRHTNHHLNNKSLFYVCRAFSHFNNFHIFLLVQSTSFLKICVSFTLFSNDFFSFSINTTRHNFKIIKYYVIKEKIFVIKLIINIIDYFDDKFPFFFFFAINHNKSFSYYYFKLSCVQQNNIQKVKYFLTLNNFTP